MKAGTSTIRLSGNSHCIRPCSIDSPTTLSDTRPPSAGHTWPSAASSAGESGVASGRSGNTVSRSAVMARCLSIIGE